MTADDIYTSIAEFENGIVGTMMIDLLNRKAARNLKIVAEQGTLDWDWLGKTLTVYRSETKETEVIDLDAGKKIAAYNTGEESYEKEMQTFLDAIYGKAKYPYSFAEDAKIMAHLESFEDIA